ncbi:hypothetical protein [Virgisporangium aurantiacum]|uniref:Leucine rich repeat variant n=1 Tax=Virgisporangium aurantiacum TaxID=175570 RepID=A0A8J3Z8S1_9ACTN|nr:hypothetical protein [Virgisporangium aurantiacum]GIJ57291.1 hypothetical protein Vau01_048070 [Virgisporangium aurantiacum]
MFGNKAFHDHENKPARARLRGLARNPAIPGDLLRRLVDEQFTEIGWCIRSRPSWTDDQIGALIGHPDVAVRSALAGADHLPPAHRARLVEDPAEQVLDALVERPFMRLWTDDPEPRMPAWAFERVIERAPSLADRLADNPWVPRDLRDRLRASRPAATKPRPAPLTRAEAEAAVAAEDRHERAAIAGHPDLPADLVARLSVDPDPYIRLVVSMRPELTEQQRAAIDYVVRPGTRLLPLDWVRLSEDPHVQRRCATSTHIGLRRSAAMNRGLAPELVTQLSADDDFAVRLLLCETHAAVPADLVVTTYIEARTLSRSLLLDHPSLKRDRLDHLAASPDPRLRALAHLDPRVPAEVIERLSHDPERFVRAWVADDGRLSPGRVRELFGEPDLSGRAAANPHLPAPVMRRIIDVDGAELANEQPPEGMAIALGAWTPETLPFNNK